MSRYTSIIAVLCLIGMLAFAYRQGAAIEEGRGERAMSALKAKLSEEHASALIAARADEQAKAKVVSMADQKLIKELKNAKNEYDSVVSSLRLGTTRVRERLTCPTTAAVPGASTSTSSSVGASGGGLLIEDAEVLLRIASQADQVVHQLTACQAILKADRD